MSGKVTECNWYGQESQDDEGKECFQEVEIISE